MTATKTVVNNDSLSDDLKKGFAYAMARRAKVGAYLLTAAFFLVNNGLVSGKAEAACNLLITVFGALAVHGVKNATRQFVVNGRTVEASATVNPDNTGVVLDLHQVAGPALGAGGLP